MNAEEIRKLVLQVATQAASSGAGWAQESVVLREVQKMLKESGTSLPLTAQQDVLNAWHDLFTEKKLSWGYDLDNPSSPFFHVR